MKNITLIILYYFYIAVAIHQFIKIRNHKIFKINIVEATGNIEMNNLIKNEIKLYSGKNTHKYL